MKLLPVMAVFVVLALGCKKKSEPAAVGSAAGSAAGSAMGSAEPGSATGSASGSAAEPPIDAAAGSAAGSAAAGQPELDPRFTAMAPEERVTCKLYATCLMDNEKLELDDATPEQEAAIAAKENGYINKCVAVWVDLKPDAKKALAECADSAGDCSGLKCFKEHKL